MKEKMSLQALSLDDKLREEVKAKFLKLIANKGESEGGLEFLDYILPICPSVVIGVDFDWEGKTNLRFSFSKDPTERHYSFFVEKDFIEVLKILGKDAKLPEYVARSYFEGDIYLPLQDRFRKVTYEMLPFSEVEGLGVYYEWYCGSYVDFGRVSCFMHSSVFSPIPFDSMCRLITEIYPTYKDFIKAKRKYDSVCAEGEVCDGD